MIPAMVVLMNGAMLPLKSEPQSGAWTVGVPQSVCWHCAWVSFRIHCSIKVPPTNEPTSPIGMPCSFGSSANFLPKYQLQATSVGLRKR